MAKAVAVEQGDRTGRSADVAEFGKPSKRTVHVLPAGADHAGQQALAEQYVDDNAIKCLPASRIGQLRQL